MVAHDWGASVGYATLAGVPLLAVRPLRDEGRTRAAAASVAVGAVAGACLLATLAGRRHGLLQRAGLTVGDAWIVASALWLLRDRTDGRR